MPDVMHGQYLGTGKALNGSVLVYLAEAGAFAPFPRTVYDTGLTTVLKVAYRDFRRWCKEEKIKVTQARFTCARLNRKQRTQFPASYLS